jgi:hypothetical protein
MVARVGDDCPYNSPKVVVTISFCWKITSFETGRSRNYANYATLTSLSAKTVFQMQPNSPRQLLIQDTILSLQKGALAI